ncbi:receptor-type tyrosine-protein phosphatase alpha-like [Dreissena polymorpha]|uniref:receptor-type tyrosine-protein phosphatase alpha-like n=1 Tax=Dreissena polymorpha TaxID=45954 RepID=UPI0022647D52|nr:receptor-type tyrosine-protein phosphatase alpha-like [Dreissena polymorpha]
MADANDEKNRYNNVFPYDKNRVVLPVINKDKNSDYINASFIDGYTIPKKYIAGQGPLSCTVEDTWRMILTERISVVVMLTNLFEESKSKCHQYWPDKLNEIVHYGEHIVKIAEEEHYADFVLRKLNCSKVGFKDVHFVTHCHFTSWPDRNVPDTALSLLQYWRKVRSVNIKQQFPWFVHCSAGVGRTGTFIALDYLYDQGTTEKQVNVFDAVLRLREQRVNMVQTQLQYLYLHDVLCEALCPIGDVVTQQTYVDNRLSTETLNDEYREMGKSYLPDYENVDNDHDCLEKFYGEKPENKQKNMDPTLIPDDKFRPALKLSVQLEGHNDYINAVHVSSFLEQNKLILTQSTKFSTEIDFVRLLHDHNVKDVVTFCEKVSPFVPVGDSVLLLGSFTAIPLSNISRGTYVEYVVRYKHIEQKSFDVRVFHFLKWPKDAYVCKADDLLKVIIAVQDYSKNGPVVIQCNDGFTRSGMFAVMWCLLERIKCEGNVAVAETVRMVRKRRKQVITSEEQYRFCHECIRTFVEGCNLYMNDFEVK